MSCCKGTTATCKGCGFKGCDKCQVYNYTRGRYYCSSCYDKIKIINHMDSMKEYIEYLRSILDEHNIYYHDYNPFN